MQLSKNIITEFCGSAATFYTSLDGTACVEVVDALGIHKRHEVVEYAKRILAHKRMMNRLRAS